MTTNPGILSSQQFPADPNCREVIAFIRAYLDGELAQPQVTAFEQHLAICDSCTAYLATYRASIVLAKVVHTDPEKLAPPLPPELVRAIMSSVKNAPRAADQPSPQERPRPSPGRSDAE